MFASEEMNLPVFWPEHVIAAMEGSEVQITAMHLKEELLEDFQKLQARLNKTLDFPKFQWAWSIYSSRVMSLSTLTGSIFAIVPGLDMFNHSFRLPAGLFKICDEHVVVRAGEDLKAGEQAFINYSADMYNSQMLISFGFLLERDSSEITLSLQPSSAQRVLHQEILKILSAPNCEVLHDSPEELIVKHILTMEDPLPKAFLCQVRIQHLQFHTDSQQLLKGLPAKELF